MLYCVQKSNTTYNLSKLLQQSYLTMKAKVLQVHWHEQQPIFSLSFDNCGRLATAGGDCKIRLWNVNQQSISSHDGMNMIITYRSTLKRHLKAVNIVRFHPNEHILASGGDGGTIIIWKLKDMTQNIDEDCTNENISNVQNQQGYSNSSSTTVQTLSSFTFTEDCDGDESEPDAEIWIPTAMYRASENLEDIYDMSWSKSGDFLIVGLTNNTSSIWDLQQGIFILVFSFLIIMHIRSLHKNTQRSSSFCSRSCMGFT